MQPQAKDCRQPRELGKKRSSPGVFRGSKALLTPRFLTSGLQNGASMNFCCFKPPCLWHFVIASPRRLTHWPSPVHHGFRVAPGGSTLGSAAHLGCSRLSKVRGSPQDRQRCLG